MCIRDRQEPDWGRKTLYDVPGPGHTELIRDPESLVTIVSTIHPHSIRDLALAPALLHIEDNLQILRGSDDLMFALALELNDMEDRYRSPVDRAGRVQEAATRNVDLHGLTVRPTDDLYGLEVAHDEYRVSVMLGKQLVEYVEHGQATKSPPAT